MPNDREMSLEEIALFVSLIDRGVGPREYYQHFGFRDENVRYHLGRISGYRRILEDEISEVRHIDIEWARQFCLLIDKGAGLRAFRSLGISSTEECARHTKLLDKFRKALKLAQGVRVDEVVATIKVYSPNFIIMSDRQEIEGRLCSAIVIGTTVKDRQDRFRQVIESFNEYAPNLALKVVSIDDFGDGVPEEFLAFLKSTDWKVIVARRRGMVKSQRDALACVSTPWTIYCEDDASIAKFPSDEEISIIDSVRVNGRRCGILSYMAGGYEIGCHTEAINAELREPTSYVGLHETDVIWVRNDGFRNYWFVEFPISMMRTQLMKNCSDFITNRNLPYQIEHGFTTAWFEMGYASEYFKATYMKDPRSIKALHEYSHADISNVFHGQNLIHARLLSSYSLDSGHNFSQPI
jgi:hypothetical protein